MLAEVLALTAARKARSRLVGNHDPKHVQITDFDPSNLAIARDPYPALPLPYPLALGLRDAGVAAEVICRYVNVEATLEGPYRITEAKSPAGQKE
jgi:hypothetical protein